jgi:thioredoxin reductase (NADPH)
LTSFLFLFLGAAPRTEWLDGVVRRDDDGFVLTGCAAGHDTLLETSAPGVFAAGDVADHRYRQAVTAAGTGCMAAIDAERFLAHG